MGKKKAAAPVKAAPAPAPAPAPGKRKAPTKDCPACGKPNHSRQRICKHCGKEIPQAQSSQPKAKKKAPAAAANPQADLLAARDFLAAAELRPSEAQKLLELVAQVGDAQAMQTSIQRWGELVEITGSDEQATKALGLLF